jgi:AcrR family transcriptional regulator
MLPVLKKQAGSRRARRPARRGPRGPYRPSAETRQRLYEAVFDLLVQRGYAGLSAAEVARRASCSAGAMAHHFPTKADLVCGAADYLGERYIHAFVEALGRVPRDASWGRGVVELAWSVFDGPLFQALLELWTAARTDRPLRERLRASARRNDRLLAQSLAAAAERDGVGGSEQLVAVGKVVSLAIQGLVLLRTIDKDEAERRLVLAELARLLDETRARARAPR